MCVGVDACVHVYACVWVGRRSSCGSGGGGCLSQCFSFFMHTHVYAHVHLPHSSSICSFLYVSISCLWSLIYHMPEREHSLLSISTTVLSFKCICLSHPFGSSDYPLFYLSKPLLHDLFVCLPFPPFIPPCLPFLPSSPSEMSLCCLFDQR